LARSQSRTLAVLVVGDEETNRTFRRTAFQEIRRGHHERRHAAFHVGRTPPVEHAIGKLGPIRIMVPERPVAGGHDIGVTRETEIGPCGAEPRIEIFGGQSARRFEPQPLALESQRFQRAFEHAEDARVFRRHRRAADQGLAKRDGIDSRHGRAI
jgi:hypothetical protein